MKLRSPSLLNVAQTLYNPFGCDDEDFELIGLLNRHFKVAMRIVDDRNETPELREDYFWSTAEPELIESPNMDGQNYTGHYTRFI